MWIVTYQPTTSVWKMLPSWHRIGHSGGDWQQAELRTEMAKLNNDDDDDDGDDDYTQGVDAVGPISTNMASL